MAGCKDCSVHVAPSTCHRCETGSVREAAIWDSSRHENHQLVQGLASEICALGEAERQLSESGTLSQKTYREVTRLLEEEERKRIESEKDNEPLKAEIDRDLFLTYHRSEGVPRLHVQEPHQDRRRPITNRGGGMRKKEGWTSVLI